jgi:hypothetical protein
LRGEGGAAGAALRVGAAVDAEFAGGETDVAGAFERPEETPVLSRLGTLEGTGHPHDSAGEILFCKAISRAGARERAAG